METTLSTNLNLPRQDPPTVFLICGFIGSGKTTYAIDLADRAKALRFSLDEWVNKLYGPNADHIKEFDPQARVKQIMWPIAEQALKLGINVVLDWGFWRSSERSEYRAKSESIGSVCKLVYLESSKEDCYRRVLERNRGIDPLSVKIDMAHFDKWWRLFEAPQEEDNEIVKIG